jgi:hypothetical protein
MTTATLPGTGSYVPRRPGLRPGDLNLNKKPKAKPKKRQTPRKSK